MNAQFRRVFILIALVSLGGCATHGSKALYYWGEYEDLLLAMYTEPGNADTETQIQKLNQDISIAKAKNLKVAPGVYAHLGVMYARKGEIVNARISFESEKALYPESSHFIDGMLERSGI